MSPPTACTCLFFARVARHELLDLVEFYREDVDALEALGFCVTAEIRNRAALRRPRPDLVYCWWHHSAFPTILGMRLRGVPVVVTGALHADDNGARRPQDRARLALSRLAARLASLNIAISEVEERGLDFLPAGRALEVPLSVDTAYFTPPTAPPSPHAISIAQLNPISVRRKGIDLAIAAVPALAERVPGFHLHVVGLATSEGEALVQELVAASDPSRITVHGGVSRERKRELLRASGVYLQMSTIEGFGLAALEAMACGVPVVHSGRGSLPEVVGKAGLVAERTAEAVADAVASVLGDPADPPLGAWAREQAESFSRPVRLARLEAALDRVLPRLGSEPGALASPAVIRGPKAKAAARVRAVRDRVLGHAEIADPRKRVLNVGCGVDLMPHADNVDVVETAPGVIAVDLNAFPWPLPSDRYDYVVAINVMEHLAEPVRAVEEMHRVLKPGGVAVLRTPYWNSPDQFADLTHRNAFGHRSFDMFDPDTHLGRQRSYYTPTRFTIERYLAFVRPFGVYVPVAGPKPLLSLLLRFAERFGRVVWSQEHWLRKRA